MVYRYRGGGITLFGSDERFRTIISQEEEGLEVVMSLADDDDGKETLLAGWKER